MARAQGLGDKVLPKGGNKTISGAKPPRKFLETGKKRDPKVKKYGITPAEDPFRGSLGRILDQESRQKGGKDSLPALLRGEKNLFPHCFRCTQH
jgi:hypothetical protein